MTLHRRPTPRLHETPLLGHWYISRSLPELEGELEQDPESRGPIHWPNVILAALVVILACWVMAG